MLDYFDRPAVAEHGVLLCGRTLPFVPFGDCLQAGGFDRGNAAHCLVFGYKQIVVLPGIGGQRGHLSVNAPPLLLPRERWTINISMSE